MSCFCKTSYFKRTSVIVEKTSNKRSSETNCRLKPFVSYEIYIILFTVNVILTETVNLA